MVKNLRAFGIVLLAIMFTLFSANMATALMPTATESDLFTLDHGHVDIFHATSIKPNNLVLQMADDTDSGRKYRTPESAILQVNSDRWKNATALGSFAKYTDNQPAAILPLSQEQDSLWPGWDMLEARGADAKNPNFKELDIVFTEVVGPKDGKMLIIGGASGGLGSKNYIDYFQESPNAESTKYQVRAGKYIHIPDLSHTHMYWIFTKPGIYQFKALVREGQQNKQRTGNCACTREATYSWRVLDEKNQIDFKQQMQNYGTPISDKTCRLADQTPKHKIIGNANPPTQMQLFGNDRVKQLEDTVKRLRAQLQNLHADLANFNKITLASHQSSLPNKNPNSRARSASTTNAGTNYLATGMHIIPKNTHVHPNWVFTAPGKYTVVIRQTARLFNGKVVYADAPLTFNVGGSGNANSGHYDLGAQLQNGRFSAVVKDDHHSPSRYVSPASLRFGLGNAAAERSPRGIEFIAKAGAQIYRIPEVQKSNVPWLGANTMNSGIINQVSGGVTWSIASYSGPGDMAIFTGGGFGGNYQVWFNTRAITGRSAGVYGIDYRGKNVTSKTVEKTTKSETGEVKATGDLGQPQILGTQNTPTFMADTNHVSKLWLVSAIGVLLAGIIILLASLALLKSKSK